MISFSLVIDQSKECYRTVNMFENKWIKDSTIETFYYLRNTADAEAIIYRADCTTVLKEQDVISKTATRDKGSRSGNRRFYLLIN